MLRSAATLTAHVQAYRAQSVPSDRLRAAKVRGPRGERLGVVRLVIRRPDDRRLVVVHRRFPTRLRLVLGLDGAYLDRRGVLNVRSTDEAWLIGAADRVSTRSAAYASPPKR
jgi:hypothetical protein